MAIAPFKAPDTIFVYQMGKVGSTALEKAIPDSLHLHSMFNNPPCPVRAKVQGSSFARRLRRKAADRYKVSLIRARPITKIITLVRNPFERNVSMYFQDLPYWLSAFLEKYPHRMRDEGLELLFDAFTELFPHDYPARWFDLELKAMTGINVFNHTFNVEKGFTRIQSDSFDVLVVRADKVDALRNEITNFVGRPVQLLGANRGSEKWYAGAYDAFKQAYQPPKELVMDMFSSSFASHFFSKVELESMRVKARNKPLG